ncbi:MAG: hypothetical protein QOC97_901, partial [Chloroflexota bacterium]|nr:hypothetical protein [Chloroflexota bacterium]
MNVRKVTALLGALVLTFSVASSATATAPTGHKVTICHATSSETHPYVSITVDIAAAGYPDGDNGHAGHTGPVWYPGAKADGVDWGDIIPPYTYHTFVYAGMNWPEGQAILEAGCTIPGESAHNPAIHVEKTADPTTLSAGGGDVTYTYVVTNTGDVPLSTVSVSDNKCSSVTYVSGDANDDGVLDLTETWTFTCTTNLTATTTNTATATGHYRQTAVTDTDEATVTVAASAPAIHVVKSADPTTLPAGGGPVEYTYLVTNTGNVPLTGVTVTDDKCTTVTGPTGDAGNDGVLGLTETWTYTCTTSLAVTTTNTVTATGHAGGTEVSDTDQATVTVGSVASAPAIHVIKSADPTALPVGGGSVTYTYVVTNTGNVALTGVTVTDDKCDSVTGPTGDTGSDGSLGLTETWTYTCTTTLSTTTTNTVTATGHAGATEVSDTDQATVTVAVAGQAGISLTKTADPATLPAGGGNVTYTYVVTNIGGIALTHIVLTDDNGTPSNTADDFTVDCPHDTLAVGAHMTCTAAVSGTTQTTTNIAMVLAQAGGGSVSATASATVTVAAPGGAVLGETSPPRTTAPPTDAIGPTT